MKCGMYLQVSGGAFMGGRIILCASEHGPAPNAWHGASVDAVELAADAGILRPLRDVVARISWPPRTEVVEG